MIILRSLCATSLCDGTTASRAYKYSISCGTQIEMSLAPHRWSPVRVACTWRLAKSKCRRPLHPNGGRRAALVNISPRREAKHATQG